MRFLGRLRGICSAAMKRENGKDRGLWGDLLTAAKARPEKTNKNNLTAHLKLKAQYPQSKKLYAGERFLRSTAFSIFCGLLCFFLLCLLFEQGVQELFQFPLVAFGEGGVFLKNGRSVLME